MSFFRNLFAALFGPSALKPLMTRAQLRTYGKAALVGGAVTVLVSHKGREYTYAHVEGDLFRFVERSEPKQAMSRFLHITTETEEGRAFIERWKDAEARSDRAELDQLRAEAKARFGDGKPCIPLGKPMSIAELEADESEASQ